MTAPARLIRHATALLGVAAVAAAGLGGASAASARPATIDRAAVPVTTASWFPDWYPGDRGARRSWPSAWPRPAAYRPIAAGPLSGRTIVVDPGHNSGNFSHLGQINRHYWVGLDKACNTTGTETRSGYLEAAYTFDVGQRLVRLLREAGARVVITRDTDSRSTYGPCIQARGLLAGQVGADLAVSIHADGGPWWGRGAFAYTPSRLTGYTSTEKARASVLLGRAIIAGLEGKGLRRSTYIPAVDPDRMQGTLNVASVPIAIVETLNMANASDAAIAESRSGRQRVAEGIFAGIVSYFG